MIDDSPNSSLLNFRGGFSIHPEEMECIEDQLNHLLDAIPAKMILLVDTSGQMVASVGDNHALDTTALGSLIAGDLAASQEIARMTGEFQAFQMILREGDKSHIIISDAGHHLTFMVQFSKDVPLGWARKLIQKTACTLGNIELHASDPIQEVQNELNHDGLSDLFSDALDDIWKG